MTRPLQPPAVTTGLGVHTAGLTLLLLLVGYGWLRLGQPHPVPFWSAIAIPIAHQLYVWLCWRWELKSAAISRVMGFVPYVVIFFLLLVGRVIAILWLTWGDFQSLGAPPIIRWGGGAFLLGLGLATNFSVARSFGWARAAGADHFFPAYRELPLVRKGMFRLTPNAMYLFGFMLLWGIALLGDSSAALLAAAFSHAYIWLHWLATERPDMKFLYGARQSGRHSGEERT